MPLPKHIYTSNDYWSLPDEQRAELIDGQLYNMVPPSRMHQMISGELCTVINNYIKSQKGSCQSRRIWLWQEPETKIGYVVYYRSAIKQNTAPASAGAATSIPSQTKLRILPVKYTAVNPPLIHA